MYRCFLCQEDYLFFLVTLLGTNLWKKKIIFPASLQGDIVVIEVLWGLRYMSQQWVLLSHSFAISTKKKTILAEDMITVASTKRSKTSPLLWVGGPTRNQILLAWVFLGVFVGWNRTTWNNGPGFFEGDSGGHTWMGLDEEHLRFHPRV